MGAEVLMRLNEAALQAFKDSGISMENFRLSDEAREILHASAPIRDPLALETEDLHHPSWLARALQDYSNDYYIEQRMKELEPEIRQQLLEAGLTYKDLIESCDRVQKYWRLIDIQQTTSDMKHRGSEEARKLI